MFKRLAFLLPIIASMVLFVAPARAVTLPNICGGGKWISCGGNAYYCSTMKGDSCSRPTFVAPRAMENWSQKTGTVVPKGVTLKSIPTKYVYKYLTKRVCKKNSKGKIISCSYKKVRTLVKRA